MLHTNHGKTQIEMTVYNPSSEVAEESGITPLTAPCSTTEQLMVLFEQATGWKVEFAESRASLQRRKFDGSDTIAQGTFEIVDMSEDWPAEKPTAHRGNCDHIVDLIQQLVDQNQTTQLELVQARSALAAFDPNANVDEVELVDSFVPKFGPKFGRRSTDRVQVEDPSQPPSPKDAFLTTTASKENGEFELHQPVVEDAPPVCPPFDGWSLGGATGIVDNFYLDWMVDDDERISICVGEIEKRADSVLESTLSIDPLTNEYWFKQTEPGHADSAITSHVFYLWDSTSPSLTPINRSKLWTRLNSEQAIVATTAANLDEISGWEKLDSGETSADEIAAMLRKSLSANAPLLVLKRD